MNQRSFYFFYRATNAAKVVQIHSTTFQPDSNPFQVTKSALNSSKPQNHTKSPAYPYQNLKAVRKRPLMLSRLWHSKLSFHVTLAKYWVAGLSEPSHQNT